MLLTETSGVGEKRKATRSSAGKKVSKRRKVSSLCAHIHYTYVKTNKYDTLTSYIHVHMYVVVVHKRIMI